MLFWHKYNVERAMTDLANFTPYPDDWSVEDKVLFEQAFSFHGKVFHRIRYYTAWKALLGVLFLLTGQWTPSSRVVYVLNVVNV